MKAPAEFNGPNLNLLGRASPAHLRRETLADVEAACRTEGAVARRSSWLAFQSNHEGAPRRPHPRRPSTRACASSSINPGALTHTSVALRDALAGVAIPFIEVHLSNVHEREPFRHHSFLSDIAEGVIVGLGTLGYRLALQAAAARLKRDDETP